MEKIGLVTITYNSALVIRDFLDSVFSQTFQNFILYIVDNNSQDNTLDILKEYTDRRISIIKNYENFGVSRANNQAIKLALDEHCTHVMIINNDVEFESHLIEKLLRFQLNNQCSLVAPKMMYYNNPNSIWYAGGWFIKTKGYLPVHRGMNKLDVGQFNIPVEVEYAPTCCLLVDKKVFLDIGFMDEKYFVYFDDTDFSYRIYIDKRHKIYYYPDVKFYHKVGSLTKSFISTKNGEYRGAFFIEQNVKNHIYFLRKIGTVFSYFFIVLLFFKNNIRFFISASIPKNFSTWSLINKSYFEGLNL